MSGVTDFTNLLPPLSDDEYRTLKADIAERGVLVPVEIDEDGNVLDGAHRSRACEELGVECPTVTRIGLSDEQKAEHALALNLKRRHLPPVAWGRMFKQVAELRGIRLGRGGDRRSTESTDTVAVGQLATELGVSERTAQRRVELAQTLEAHPDLAQKVDRNEIEAKRALRVVRERDAEERKRDEPPAPEPTGDIDIRHCDLRDLDLEPESVDLIFTDPPYPFEYLSEWDALAEFADHALKPGCLLVAYSGQFHLPAVMQALDRALDYVWLGALLTPGAHNMVHARGIRSTVKPLLFYAKAPRDVGPWFDDSYASEERAKDDHEWQQSVGAAHYYIESLTQPGALVVDPFLGSGTTAIAARTVGRSFVGCDIDTDALDVTKRRLAA